MKFEKTSKLSGDYRYQAQFQSPNEMKRATEWLASRPSKDWRGQQASIYTNDLQVIFELRVHFDRSIKTIRAVQQA